MISKKEVLPADNNKAIGRHAVRKPVVKHAVSEEDVQKQIKETLARLTEKVVKIKGRNIEKKKLDAVTQKAAGRTGIAGTESSSVGTCQVLLQPTTLPT